MRCLLRRKRRAVHTPEVALLSIERYFIWCACVGRKLLQPQYAVTGRMFHVIISLGLLISVGVGLWGSRGVSVSLAPARGARRPRARPAACNTGAHSM